MIEDDEMMAVFITAPIGKLLREMCDFMEENDKKTHHVILQFKDVKFTVNAELLGGEE